MIEIRLTTKFNLNIVQFYSQYIFEDNLHLLRLCWDVTVIREVAKDISLFHALYN